MSISPQWLFLAKAAIVPPWLALLIWVFVKVPPNSGLLSQKAQLGGSDLSWAWLGALNSALGNYATLGVKIPDFTVGHTFPCHVAASTHVRPSQSEICQKRKSVGKHLSAGQPSCQTTSRRQYIQCIIIPIAFTLGGFIGTAVTSAGIALYDQVPWDPLKLIAH
jgi:NCS1 family nucleobase:cation symporter-1